MSLIQWCFKQGLKVDFKWGFIKEVVVDVTIRKEWNCKSWTKAWYFQAAKGHGSNVNVQKDILEVFDACMHAHVDKHRSKT